jgi:hypothetical protein
VGDGGEMLLSKQLKIKGEGGAKETKKNSLSWTSNLY